MEAIANLKKRFVIQVRGVHRVVLRVLQHPHPDSGAPAPYPDSEKLK